MAEPPVKCPECSVDCSQRQDDIGPCFVCGAPALCADCIKRYPPSSLDADVDPDDTFLMGRLPMCGRCVFLGHDDFKAMTIAARKVN